MQPADLPTDTEAEFGDTLDIDGNLAIIGMANEDMGGAAYIFDTAGTQLHKLIPPIDPETENAGPGLWPLGGDQRERRDRRRNAG